MGEFVLYFVGTFFFVSGLYFWTMRIPDGSEEIEHKPNPATIYKPYSVHPHDCVYFLTSDNKVFTAYGFIQDVTVHKTKVEASSTGNLPKVTPKKLVITISGESLIYPVDNVKDVPSILQYYIDSNTCTPAQLLAFARALDFEKSAEVSNG